MKATWKKPFNSIFLFIDRGMRKGWLPLALYLIISVLCAFFRELVNTDELWNYTFALNITNGLLPYRDFNYLQTPFSAFVNAALLTIFGKHILVMRLAGAVLFAAIAMSLFRTSRRLGASPLLASIPGFVTILIFSVNIYFEYADFIMFILIVLTGADIKAVNRVFMTPYPAKSLVDYTDISGRQQEAGRPKGFEKVPNAQQEASRPQGFEKVPNDQQDDGRPRRVEKVPDDQQEAGMSQDFGKAPDRQHMAGILRDVDKCQDNLQEAYSRQIAVRNLLLGVLGGLAILSKQTYGTFAAAASWIAAFIICIAAGRGLGKAVRVSATRFLGSMIPCCVFLLYLLGTGTFADFWDMCVDGIGTFTSFYRYTTLMMEQPGFFVACVAMPVCVAAGIIFAAAWHVKGSRLPREAGREYLRVSLQMTIILLYIFFGFINMVPIANLFHFETCAVPVMLAAELIVVRLLPWINDTGLLSGISSGRRTGGYAGNEDITRQADDGRDVPGGVFSRYFPNGQAFAGFLIRMAVRLALIAELVFLIIWNPVYMSRNFEFTTDINGFEGTFISENLADEIRTVDSFIERENAAGYEVYVLDNKASYYMDPLNIYHKYLDFFLIGNLGTKAPIDCLRESLTPRSIYLIPSDMDSNTQYPKNAIEEFMEGLRLTGKLGDYYIYRTYTYRKL